MKDIGCPYCGYEIDIYLDEEEPNDYFESECPHCKKNFMLMFQLEPSFYAKQADCLNGGEHEMQNIFGSPSWFFAGKKRCKHCNHETFDKKVYMKAVQDFKNSHDGQLY